MVVSYAKSYETSLNKNTQVNQLQEVLVAQSVSNQNNGLSEPRVNSRENQLKQSIIKSNSQINHKQSPNHQDHRKTLENVKALVDEFTKLNYENFDTYTTINSYPHILSIEGVSRNKSELENQIKNELGKVAANDFNDLTPSNVFCHKIELINPNINPVKQKIRPVPFNLREKSKAYLDEQIASKLIEPSNSPWSSPIHIVGKKDGGIRITQDYRLLNQLTVKDAYFLPVIDHLFSKLSKSRYFTKLDCFCGFYQIRLDPKSKSLTAFSCESGHFQFCVMPMGLTNATAPFQRNGTIKSRKVTIIWNDEAKKSLKILREALCGENVLIIPVFTKDFILITDASDYGYGFILCQEYNSELKPVAYFSKQMNTAQQSPYFEENSGSYSRFSEKKLQDSDSNL
ncbi:unnamed protein product [Brachionus calyciflorus]|uniref:Reverse transcriptase/retrotransposon-derived protein RNase H-like domain-containing protein n=1 Tax=Brachionus calyciflorus TaxID=104777 RepID=A0A813ZQI6_9BILA|nr:unnamed protein product [Brachionus calyciflorus]